MKTAPEYPWGGRLLWLDASGDNRPGAQGKLTLRARLHISVSFRAVPERHDSMIRDTHRRSNAIFAHLLPGQSHMVGAHSRSPGVCPSRGDTRIAPRPRRPDLQCARGGVQPGRAAARLRRLGQHGPSVQLICAVFLAPVTRREGRRSRGMGPPSVLRVKQPSWSQEPARDRAATWRKVPGGSGTGRRTGGRFPSSQMAPAEHRRRPLFVLFIGTFPILR